MSPSVQRWAPLVAFLFIALVGGYAIQQSSQRDAELLHAGLIEACERDNARDARANQRTDIMAEVLAAAAESRDREARLATDPERAEVIRQVADRYRELVSDLPYAETVDCEKAVPSP